MLLKQCYFWELFVHYNLIISTAFSYQKANIEKKYLYAVFHYVVLMSSALPCKNFSSCDNYIYLSSAQCYKYITELMKPKANRSSRELPLQ